MQRLWSEVLEEVPDIYRMHAASCAVYAAEEAAEKAFSQLLALNPQSLLVIRLYAEHCLRLMNDKEKADLLFADAERIDEVSCHIRHIGESSNSETNFHRADQQERAK